MSMAAGSPDPLLIAAWANEERLGRQSAAARDRAHIAEDREAAIARGRRDERARPWLLARIAQAVLRRR